MKSPEIWQKTILILVLVISLNYISNITIYQGKGLPAADTPDSPFSIADQLQYTSYTNDTQVIANQTLNYYGIIDQSKVVVTHNIFNRNSENNLPAMVLIENSTDIEVSFNQFMNTDILAIKIVNSRNILIDSNTIIGKAFTWHAISVINSSEITITGNEVSETISSLLIENSHQLLIEDNNITNNVIGINAYNTYDIKVISNYFSYLNYYFDNKSSYLTCGSLQFQGDGENISIVGNTISNVKKTSGICINLNKEDNTIIANNTIQETDQAAIFAYLEKNAALTNNTMINVNGGIFLLKKDRDSVATNIIISSNSIMNSRSQAISTGPVENMIIENNWFEHISNPAYAVSCIELPTITNNISISNNTFVNADIAISGGSGLLILENTFLNIWTQGIYLWKGQNNTVANNLFNQTHNAIEIEDSNTITIDSNTFFNPTGNVITIIKSSDLEIVNNNVYNMKENFVKRDLFSINQIDETNNTVNGKLYKHSYFTLPEILGTTLVLVGILVIVVKKIRKSK